MEGEKRFPPQNTRVKNNIVCGDRGMSSGIKLCLLRMFFILVGHLTPRSNSMPLAIITPYHNVYVCKIMKTIVHTSQDYNQE